MKKLGYHVKQPPSGPRNAHALGATAKAVERVIGDQRSPAARLSLVFSNLEGRSLISKSAR